jgi:hypothetical protein
MAVIGTLTVDLVANTAQFSGDMGKAAQSAEQFGIKAAEAGKQVDFSMREAKGSMMLASEELGVHIPRHLQALIAQIPSVGAAFAEMLPIVGVIAAIAIISKLIAKNEEAKEKLSQGWDKFDIETSTVFGDLDEKMLKVGKTADELAGRHLAALQKELELIDHTSLKELAQEFGKLEKAGHTLMVEMKSSWYEIRMGSQGAENALTRFTGEYDLLLAKGDKKGAFDKLVGTLDAANKELKLQEEGLKAIGAQDGKKIEAQRLLVSILEDQLRVTKEVDAINTGEKTNAKTGEAQAEQGRQEKIYQEQQKGLEQRRKAEERYSKEREKLAEKAAKEEERIEEERAKASEAVATWEMKVQEGLAAEGLKQTDAMAKLEASEKEQQARHNLAMGQATAAQTLDIEIEAIQKRQEIETAALNREAAFLVASGKKEEVKLKEIEDKKTQIIRQSANEQTKLRETAAEKQFQVIERAELKTANAIAKTTARSIIEGQNMAQAFAQLGKQMAASAMDSLIQMETIEGRKKLLNAKGAATSAFKWVMQDVPFPVNAVLAPIAAGAAFAGVMAFEHGGQIPGHGPVPIVGHGGETVVTKALTDRVEASEGKGAGKRPVTIVQNIMTKDADSFKASQSQLHSKAFHTATVAAKRNR